LLHQLTNLNWSSVRNDLKELTSDTKRPKATYRDIVCCGIKHHLEWGNKIEISLTD